MAPPHQMSAAYARDVARYPLLDRDEEHELAVAAKAGDRNARARLISCNLRLVMKIAARYRRYGLSFDELVQEGNVGLIKGVDRFDPEAGTRLSTYASWWIRAMITKHLIATWSLVRLGTTQAQRKLFFSLRGAMARHRTMNGELDEAAVAEELGVRVKDVREMRQRILRETSLETIVGDADGGPGIKLVDLVADNGPGADETVAREALAEMATRVLEEVFSSSALNAKEKTIVRRRLLSDDPDTLVAIGDDLGLSRERIRQLESRAKDKLRDAFLDAGLRPDDIVPGPRVDAGIAPAERSLA